MPEAPAPMTAAGATLRPARPDDRDRVLDWANDPETRRASFHGEPIPAATHARWFDAALAGACHLYIIELGGVAAGVARLERTAPGTAEASVNVAPGHRGRGVGTAAIAQLVARAADAGYRDVVARVRTDNAASCKAFARAGFEQAGRDTVNGVDAFLMTIRTPG